jgi:hypothetical protein
VSVISMPVACQFGSQSAAKSRTTRSAIVTTRPIRSTGVANSMTLAHERLDDAANAKLVGLLDAGDPNGEVRYAWHAKEVVRSIATSTTPSRRPSSSPSSAVISKISGVRPRSAASVAASSSGDTQVGCVAPGEVHERAYRARQQPRQERGLRDHELDELSNPITALRRQTELDTPRLQLTPTSEALDWCFGFGCEFGLLR